MNERFWTERSVPGSPSWPLYRGRFLSRYRLAYPVAGGGSVLDVACGVGYGTHLLASEGSAAAVLGVDISEEAVAFARANYASPAIRFETGNAHEISRLGGDAFDLVVSMGTLEHVEHPDMFARGVHQVLRSGGVWLVTMLNPAAHTGMDEHHFQEWPAARLRAFLEQHFGVVELRWHVPLDRARAATERNRRRFRYLPEPIKCYTKRLLGRRLSLTIALRGASVTEPEDYAWATAPDLCALEFVGLCRK